MSAPNEPRLPIVGAATGNGETASRRGFGAGDVSDETVDAPRLDAMPQGDETIGFEREVPPSGSPRGRRFGDYELIDEIARGGMGIVYKARQVSLNRVVALKMILAGQFAGPEDVQRFVAEAESAAQLDHPGIVPIYETGSHDGHHFFSMGFVDGPSLARRVAERPFSPQKATELTVAIAEAVQYAHDRGIVHRDLKPSNVLLDERGVPRVTDFGLAKRSNGGSDLTQSGQILGTPSYMPPEQAAGRLDEIGPRSDVYALGALLYCLLAGRPPFASANPIDTLSQVLHQEPVSLRKLDATIPKDLETICLKCLEKNPARRYESAQALIEDLRRFQAGEPVRARPVGLFGKSYRWLKKRPLAAGCATLGLGVSLVVASVAASAIAVTCFSTTLYDLVEDREDPAVTLSLATPSGGVTESFALPPDGLHELELRTKIAAPTYDTKLNPAAGMTPANDDDLFPAEPATRIEAKFNFPVRYEIVADDGTKLASGAERVVWNSGWKRIVSQQIDAERNVAVAEAWTTIVRFHGAGAERATAKIDIGPDERYDARIEEAELVLYENVRDTRFRSSVGGALCVAAPLLLAIGVLLSLLGPTMTAVFSRAR